MSRLRNLAISDNGFIFDPQTGQSYTVNTTGYSVIQYLKMEMPVVEIIEQITEEYEVSRAEAERDVIDFQEALKAMRLS